MNKRSTIITFLFSLLVSSGTFADELDNMEELLFRSSLADIGVCGDLAYDLGDKEKTQELANHMLSQAATRVCKSKQVAKFFACAMGKKFASWGDLSSTCNSLFSKTSKEEMKECMNLAGDYVERFVLPISNKRGKEVDLIAKLSGESKDEAAKAFYAENCPY